MRSRSHILFLDFETYYDSDYTLKKLTPVEYILDARWEEICLGAAIDNGSPQIIQPEDIDRFLLQFPPEVTTTVTFNSLFDNSILKWRHNYVPQRICDAMGLARSLRGHILPSASLAMCCAVLGIGAKGTAIEQMNGVHLADLRCDHTKQEAFYDYCKGDVSHMREIWRMLIGEMPPIEKRIMDLVIKCGVDPALYVDIGMLQEHLKAMREEKAQLLAQCSQDIGREVTKADLMSAAKFEELLHTQGIEVEYKTSNTGTLIPAFAKTDQFMAELQEHENEVVRFLASARLNMKSTIEETRAERMLAIARATGGLMPVPLRIAGAHTHRLSGDWKINMQNLPAGRGGAVSKLRAALIAPEGSEVVAGDLAQIEARVNAWICRQLDLLEMFRLNQDPYSQLAGEIFGYPVNKKDHPLERFIGKSGELGLGFGCGDTKFYNMVVRSARAMKMDLGDVWTPELALRSVHKYRNKRSNIYACWGILQNIIDNALNGNSVMRFGPCLISHGRVELPNGMAMRYKMLPLKDGEREHWYMYGKRRHRIYGPKLLENIVQALARIILMEAGVRIADRGFDFKMQTHDELVWIILKNQLDIALPIIEEELRRPPVWGKDLPLDAEIKHGRSYADAK